MQELQDAFLSMEKSNENLQDILEAAKQSEAKTINDNEIRQIEELLRKLQDTFSNMSATELMRLSSVRGEFQEQKEKVSEISAQFQAMEALMANMGQTLLGFENIRQVFSQTCGDYNSMLEVLKKSQQTSNGARLNLLSFSMNQTKDTLERGTQ